MIGSSLAAVKGALVDLLAARAGLVGVAVGYSPPSEAQQVDGSTGLRRAVFIDDSPDLGGQEISATGRWHAAQQTLGGKAPIQEDWTLPIVCQVLGRSTSDTQRDLDTTLMLMLGEVVDAIQLTPRLSGLIPAEWTVILTPGGWRYQSGLMAGTGLRAARIVLSVGVEASTC